MYVVIKFTQRQRFLRSLRMARISPTSAPGGAVAVGMRELRACRPETTLRDVAAAKAMDLTGPATRVDVPTLILVRSQDRLPRPRWLNTSAS